MSLIAILGACLALLQSSASATVDAVPDDERARLVACLDKIETDPEMAYEDGLAWLGQGSRPAARQCVALALIALDEPEIGAAQLESLANAPDAGSLEARAVFLAQSGNAWLAAGLPDAAVTTLTNAIKLSAFDADLYKDRATAYLALGQWSDAETDLDEALSIEPANGEAHGLRARARLGLEDYAAALDDVSAARAVDPENVDLLVLRGDIREAQRLAEE